MRSLLLLFAVGCNAPELVSTSPKDHKMDPNLHMVQIEREMQHRQNVNDATGLGGEAPSPAETMTTASVHRMARTYLEEHSHNGVFRIRDHRNQKVLELELETLHTPAWRMAGRGFFAGKDRPMQWRRTGVFTCATLRVKGSDARYDLDIWMGDSNGNTAVSEILIHREPDEEKAGMRVNFLLSKEAPTPLP